MIDKERDLGDDVVAFGTPPLAATYCAYPGCNNVGKWTIMGPALMFKGLPDVCEDHLEHGKFLGCGKQPA